MVSCAQQPMADSISLPYSPACVINFIEYIERGTIKTLMFFRALWFKRIEGYGATVFPEIVLEAL
jgi:hypothetical protein